ncbi:MAG TPA: membrane protein insertion efficiency factor YidD [Elusimicrobiales bacterium]|nr:membrane protein insertion efficiency factor YidD [Elusimicrobiales bacterium]
MIDKVSRLAVYFAVCLLKIFRMFRVILGPRACRFYPTCTDYALGSLKKFGILKGSYLSVKRVCKCHPFNRGGYDPVK